MLICGRKQKLNFFHETYSLVSKWRMCFCLHASALDNDLEMSQDSSPAVLVTGESYFSFPCCYYHFSGPTSSPALADVKFNDFLQESSLLAPVYSHRPWHPSRWKEHGHGHGHQTEPDPNLGRSSETTTYVLCDLQWFRFKSMHHSPNVYILTASESCSHVHWNPFLKQTFIKSLLYAGTGSTKLSKTHLAMRELNDILNTEVIIIQCDWWNPHWQKFILYSVAWRE